MDSVPKKVYIEFVSALKQAEISQDVVSRLENTLTNKAGLTDAEIRMALLGGENTDL